MHVDECVEAAFGTGEQPVDRTFFVALYMVVVEIFEEVFSDILTDSLFDKLEVALVVFISECNTQKLEEALCDVVGKPVAIKHGDDIIVICRESWIRTLFQIIVDGFALVGKDQTWFVQRIATEQAADGVGDKLF